LVAAVGVDQVVVRKLAVVVGQVVVAQEVGIMLEGRPHQDRVMLAVLV
jgi:hypothetical protein